MKKTLLILGLVLLGFTSCQKEEKEELIQQQEVYHTVRFVGLTNEYSGYCKINGVKVEEYNHITGGPEHQCVGGDRLEMYDPGYDITMYIPGTGQISSIDHGLVECYIVVDGEIVDYIVNYGDANLEYTIPY
jgi:hypothetical protein